MMAGEVEPDEDEFGDLVALKGVVKYPIRIKCAVLAWDVLQEALGAAAPAATQPHTASASTLGGRPSVYPGARTDGRADAKRSLKPSLDWLLVLVPVAIVLELAGGPDLAIFLTSAARDHPAGGADRPVDRAARPARRAAGGRPDQRHVRQRDRADHRGLPDPGRQDRDGEGLAHRLDPREPPAGAGAVVLPRWAPAHGAAFSAQAASVHATLAGAGRDRPVDAGAVRHLGGQRLRCSARW